ncbi:hypothetical protein MRX96_039213 [Rhipicephalus microplus]
MAAWIGRGGRRLVGSFAHQVSSRPDRGPADPRLARVCGCNTSNRAKASNNNYPVQWSKTTRTGCCSPEKNKQAKKKKPNAANTCRAQPVSARESTLPVFRVHRFHGRCPGSRVLVVFEARRPKCAESSCVREWH